MPSTVEKWTSDFSIKDMLNFFVASISNRRRLLPGRK
ncbi:hypothetical protein B23_0656 [Geobacillus thermoleovorans B23]|nr:hypothetical protein B23_0656 [Geobacillus thermoleovorans B23]